MESENFEDITNSFNLIDIEDEPDIKKYDNPWEIDYKPKPTLKYTPKPYVNFEQNVRENCQNKIQILNRETFHLIKRPIIIFFNHFNEKCAYLSKWLDGFYELALKYGERIDFIAADMIDMDIMYPGRNPMNFFCHLVRPEDESPNTYAIDESKRIYNHHDAYRNLDSLEDVCENLLNGSLYLSQPIPENNHLNLVKIGVHLNYEELVLKSTKNIFLIVNLVPYQNDQAYEPNYDKLALTFKDSNLDFVYMEAEKNYIPFELHVNCYPTLIFIPSNDKNNFIYYEGFRNEEDITEFLQKVLQQPEFLLSKQLEMKLRFLKKIIQVKDDFQIDYHQDLPQFLQDNFSKNFKILDRKLLNNSKRYYYNILIFMDFPNMKCLAEHIKWLNEIYQVAERCYSYQFFIADFKDIDVINTKWHPEDLRISAQGKPKIYAFNFLKHTYELKNFNTMASLFYFTTSLENRHFYYSQVFSRKSMNQPVKIWTADYFNIFLKKCKKHIFLTFYSSDAEDSKELLNLLETIAKDVAELNIEVAIFDVKYNYVDLEYAQDEYPVHYFIPKYDKKNSRLYKPKDLNREKLMEFIKTNVDDN